MNKQNVLAYILIGGITLANLVSCVGLISRENERKKLDRSSYIAKHTCWPVSFYAYDDNRDGKIDRIEEIGAIGRCPGPVFPIRRTYSEGEMHFLDHYKLFE